MISIKAPSHRAMAFLIAAPLVVAACAGAVAEEDAETDTAAADPTAALEATPAADPPVEGTDEGSAEEPTWLDIELTDAVTGEPFTLASLSGQVVAIEPMAIWCTNCKVQQDNVKQAYPQIADDGVRYISLGVDPNENAGSLAKYADRREYPWTFAQSPVEFSRALSDIFGPQILSVPSTPLIVLDETGEVVVQEFGFHGPDRLLEILGEAAG